MKKTLVMCIIGLMALAGCKKDEEKTKDTIKISNGTSVTLYSGDRHQISASSISAISYSSGNDFCAKVNSTGQVTANHVGNTSISLRNNDDTKSVRVTVKAESNLYTEPRISFGDSKSTVESKLGTPDEINNGNYFYRNYSSVVDLLMVSFENGKVEGYALSVKTSYASELGTFLFERYAYYGEIDDYLMYGNAFSVSDATKLVGVRTNYSYIAVMYIPNLSSKGNVIMGEMDDILTKNVMQE